MQVSSDSSLWVEKYRPKTIKDLIIPDHIKDYFLNIVNEGEIPSMLFSGGAGAGKSSAAYALCNDLNAGKLYINGSMQTSIDTLRYDVTQFAFTSSFFDGKKIVILDECLEENEKVRIGFIDDYESIALKDLKKR